MVIRRLIAVKLILAVLNSSIVSVADAAHNEATLNYIRTDRGVFEVAPTGAGMTKINTGLQTVAKGVQVLAAFGRVTGAVTIGLALMEAGSLFWDWYSKSMTPSVPQTPEGVWSVGQLTGGYYWLGMWAVVPCPWTGTAPVWSPSGNVIPAGMTIKGLKIIETPRGGGCATGPPDRKLFAYVSSDGAAPSTGGVAVASIPATTNGGERAELVNKLESLAAEIRSGKIADNPLQADIVASSSYGGSGAMADVLRSLDEAARVLRQGVVLTPGTDVVDGPTRSAGDPSIAGNQVPSVSSPGTGTGSSVDMGPTNAKLDTANQTLTEMKDTPANIAGPFTCPTCSRTTSWSSLMQSWQATAQAAPIFALIGRLAWPGAGTVQRVWTVGTWNGHTFSIDLDATGIGTAITVTRFVVIGGAVIVAYMILFA